MRGNEPLASHMTASHLSGEECYNHDNTYQQYNIGFATKIEIRTCNDHGIINRFHVIPISGSLGIQRTSRSGETMK